MRMRDLSGPMFYGQAEPRISCYVDVDRITTAHQRTRDSEGKPVFYTLLFLDTGEDVIAGKSVEEIIAICNEPVSVPTPKSRCFNCTGTGFYPQQVCGICQGTGYDARAHQAMYP